MAMDEPLRSGRNEIHCSGAGRIVRGDYNLISEAPSEAPAGSNVDLLARGRPTQVLLIPLGSMLGIGRGSMRFEAKPSVDIKVVSLGWSHHVRLHKRSRREPCGR